MRLYEIAEEIENCIDYETGEVDSERLAEAVANEEQKLEGIGKAIKCMNAETVALEEEISNLQKRKKSLEKSAESMARFVGAYLGGQKRTVGTVKFLFYGKQDGTVKLLVKPGELPDKYKRLRQNYDADKTALKTDLVAGVDLSAYAVLDPRPKATVK